MSKRILSIQEALEELEQFFVGKVDDPKAAATKAMDWVLCVPDDFGEPSLSTALKPWGRATSFGTNSQGRALGLSTKAWDMSVIIARHNLTTVELALPDGVIA